MMTLAEIEQELQAMGWEMVAIQIRPTGQLVSQVLQIGKLNESPDPVHELRRLARRYNRPGFNPTFRHGKGAPIG
ncbi:MAG: hypothetical protein WC322_04895 [Candidatus Paceibacterota bacterium]|jgi:hypothetical protein